MRFNNVIIRIVILSSHFLFCPQIARLQFKVTATGLRPRPIFQPSISPTLSDSNHFFLLSGMIPRSEHLTLYSTSDKNLSSPRFAFLRATCRANVSQDQAFPLLLSSKYIALLSLCAPFYYIANGQIRMSSLPSQQ